MTATGKFRWSNSWNTCKSTHWHMAFLNLLRLDFNPHTPNWGSSHSYGLPPMHLCWHNRWREDWHCENHQAVVSYLHHTKTPKFLKKCCWFPPFHDLKASWSTSNQLQPIFFLKFEILPSKTPLFAAWAAESRGSSACGVWLRAIPAKRSGWGAIKWDWSILTFIGKHMSLLYIVLPRFLLLVQKL